MKKTTATSFAMTLALLAGGGAHAQITGQRTIYVPACPGPGACTSAPTIAAAVALANDGDAVVLTRTGQYPSIDFSGKDIVIASRWYLSGDPADIGATVVSGLVRFDAGEPRTATLMGFTVAGQVLFLRGAGTLDHVTVRSPPAGRAAVEASSDVTVLDSTITSSDIAGISLYGGRLELDGARIANNAKGIDAMGGTLIVRDSLIERNGGPGIEGYGSAVDIEDSDVRDNLGTGVFVRNQGDLVMRRCRVTGNDSPDYGGGVRADWASTLTLSDSVIAGNTAERDGGGIFATNVLVARQPLIERTIVAGNDAAMGGGIFLAYGSPRLRSVVVVGNTALYAAGVAANHVDGSDGTGRLIAGTPGLALDASTIAFNAQAIPGYHASGLADVYNSVVTVRSTILWGNGSAASTMDGVLDIDASDVEGGRSGVTIFPGQGGTIRYGADNLAADPRLVAREGDGGLQSGLPYHLSPDSPCLDRGRSAPWMRMAADIDGEARLSGASVDIGADERP